MYAEFTQRARKSGRAFDGQRTCDGRTGVGGFATAAALPPGWESGGMGRVNPGHSPHTGTPSRAYAPGLRRYAAAATVLLCVPLTAMAFSCVVFVNVS